MNARTFLQCRRYEILLGSFLLLVFGNTFFPDAHWIGAGLVTLNMLTGLLVFFGHKHLRRVIGGLILARLLLLTCLSRYQDAGNFSLKHFVYQLYFWTVAALVFQKILTVKKVSREMLAAVVCGFVILCQMAAYIFLQIELFHPHSFSNLPGGNKDIEQLTYFGFQTLLTAGYGDVIPLTLAAKHAVMFMGLMGHFYSVIVTSIIIGKYVGGDQPPIRSRYRLTRKAAVPETAGTELCEDGLAAYRSRNDSPHT